RRRGPERHYLPCGWRLCPGSQICSSRFAGTRVRFHSRAARRPSSRPFGTGDFSARLAPRGGISKLRFAWTVVTPPERTASAARSVGAAMLALWSLNLWLCWPLWRIEYLDQFQSNEGTFIAFASFLQKTFPHVRWFPWFDCGLPYEA